MLGQHEGRVVPTTKEVLLEHLYQAVYDLQPQQASQITGSYAHLTERELFKLLGDKALLQHKVYQSLKLLRQTERSADKCRHNLRCCSHGRPASLRTPDKDSLGTELFSRVAQLETELCAQITGMLLEMDVAAIQCLLREPSKLEGAVSSCRERYLQTVSPTQSQTVCTDQQCVHVLPQTGLVSQPTGDTGHISKASTTVAEELFASIAEHYPYNAAKLTGMLLELESDTLLLLVRCPELQDGYISRCKEVLLSTDQWITGDTE